MHTGSRKRRGLSGSTPEGWDGEMGTQRRKWGNHIPVSGSKVHLTSGEWRLKYGEERI